MPPGTVPGRLDWLLEYKSGTISCSNEKMHQLGLCIFSLKIGQVLPYSDDESVASHSTRNRIGL